MRLESLSQKLMNLIMLNCQNFIFEELSVTEIFEDIIKTTKVMLDKNNITLNSELDESYILVEYDLFKTLFLNLIDNAVKAGASQICVTGTVEKKCIYDTGKCDKNPSKYAVHFKDNGCGIPTNEIKKITEAFYMIDKSRSRKLHGAGLGLSLAQKIAEIHGSSLIIESDGKSGTKVTVYLDIS